MKIITFKTIIAVIISAFCMTNSFAKANDNSSQTLQRPSINTIESTYDDWWEKNHQVLSINGVNYDLIKNDGSGQGSGSIYTSEGIGMGMLTSAMLIYLYENNPSLNISTSVYNQAKSRFMDGYNYWVYIEGTKQEQAAKASWGCYNDKLLVWSRDAYGNPSSEATGSATDGDYFMVGATYLGYQALKSQLSGSDAAQMLTWIKDRSNEIYSRDFNDGLSWPYTGTPTPTLPGLGDSTCDKSFSNGASVDVEPSKAILPVMYLLANGGIYSGNQGQSLIDNTLQFIGLAESWSYQTRGNYLMGYPYQVVQNGANYQIKQTGNYDYDSGRNPENLGGYLILSGDKTTVGLINNLMTSVKNLQPSPVDSFFDGSSALGLYALSLNSSLSQDFVTYYNQLIGQTPDLHYYNTGHWLMSTLWMYMGNSPTSKK